jgi:hypothetical protein
MVWYRDAGRTQDEGRQTMIAVLILFPTEGTLTLNEASERFNTTAPNYRGREGLYSKAYIYNQDGSDLGGFYVYTDAWRARATELYGVAPVIRYYHVPVFIDNR